MNLYVEYDAASLVALGLTADPACDGVILKHGAPGEVLASTHRGNPLSGGWLADVSAPGSIIVSWSGTLAEDLFEAHPLTFLRPGHEELASFCREITPQLIACEKTLCFQPHCRHVLSDPKSCVKFRQEQAGPFGFALAPGDLLEPGMLDDIEDHLTRAFEMMGPHCAMVIVQDVMASDSNGGEEGSCRTVPLGQGVMPRAHVLTLLDECVPGGIPIVVMGESLDEQLQWLMG